MSSLVLREDAGGIATLTLNRPEALNALTPALFVELRAHIDALTADTANVGVVVLRGAGRAFSGGNDLKAIRAGERAPTKTHQAETIDALEALPQPVIASVRGYCYTGALELLLGCDLVVCAENAQFADTHGRWSMTPLWGMSQRLPRRIGPARAKLLMYTGTPVSGTRAAELGLADVCVPEADLDSATAELAATLAANSWYTLRANKRLVNEGQHYTLAEGLAFERRTSPGPGPDMAERVKAFGATS